MSSYNDLLLNSGLYEEMYQRYLHDPNSVEPALQRFFREMESKPLPELNKPYLAPPPKMPVLQVRGDSPCELASLINDFRTYGHLRANVNPLKPVDETEEIHLTLLGHGFKEENLKAVYATQGVLPEKEATLAEILAHLKHIYCGRIGVEYMGTPIEKWFHKEVEPKGYNFGKFPIEFKQMILENLAKSELIESFMHTKYVGQKRFSLEGAETLIPMLRHIIDMGGEGGTKEFVIGMAHRGRLNVLSNILNKSFSEIFSEFNESYIPESFEGTGDVKYHKGFETLEETRFGKTVNVVLTPNPSHLESVDSIVEGQVKGKQVRLQGEQAYDLVMPILIHGDGAIAGQGVVYETLQMQNLRGYKTGGTIHIIVNNQVGFTTFPEDGRSTRYCTDIAHTFESPVFHVNAEDPEACVMAADLSLQIRQKFHIDVFIDLLCYRKYGHNETDEPAFTQPLIYSQIKGRKPIKDLYRQQLIKEGALEQFMAEEIEKEFKRALNQAKENLNFTAKSNSYKPYQKKAYVPPDIYTGVSHDVIMEIAKKLTEKPDNFHIHPKIEALMKDRLAMALGTGEKKIDWGMAETLAYGTLLWEGHSIRLAGQDVERGTFSHRHAVLIDQGNEEKYIPLNQLKEDQGRFYIYNSLLSEFAALGFEYGYSLSWPDGLTIWEAQFGDFANGAQVIIDQYLSSSEQKWGQKSNLTLFLPHGFEGQGPEHSSGRLERFLSLSAHDNMRVCYPTLPSQQFHLLRRQVLNKDLKPLIVLTPKGLLRLPACTSHWSDLVQGSFKEVLDDPDSPGNPHTLCFCSGKIYYDLKAYAEKYKEERIAFIRIEQLYPLHMEAIRAIGAKYESAKRLVWAQEEPRNMGAWSYIHERLEKVLNQPLEFVGRDYSASPASGVYDTHRKEVAQIMEKVFSERPTTYEISGQLKV